MPKDVCTYIPLQRRKTDPKIAILEGKKAPKHPIYINLSQFNIHGNAPLEPSEPSLLSEEDGSAKKGISYEETFGELMFEENEQLGVSCLVRDVKSLRVIRLCTLINCVVSSEFWDILLEMLTYYVYIHTLYIDIYIYIYVLYIILYLESRHFS